ncbi:energy-coupling factor transporter ATPase [Azotosporobacter soli]|uniref:energy-coupling factor transporter ATPase n=1 Tax=Azotosporobacter soli TaxID=3055040 RepID=UPI0031FF2310
MNDFISVKNLCHSYVSHGGVEIKALENINLTIGKGEFVAVIGSNGSGKSTLAKHLNALLLPTSGECVINKMATQAMEHLWQIRQQVGMVFQNPDNQIVATTVEEDIAFGPENLGMEPARIRQNVSEALEAVGMTDFRRHSPHLLSGGQKQRVAIAGVLAMHSTCLVLDEPTAMLDPKGRQEVLRTVKKLHSEENITVIYITHFMEEAVQADRVVVMDSGRIAFEGTPRAVFSQVQRLKALGLDVPVAADMAEQLRCEKMALPPDIITDEELVVALCR